MQGDQEGWMVVMSLLWLVTLALVVQAFVASSTPWSRDIAPM